MTKPYDSAADTLGHIRRVQGYVTIAACDLLQRGAKHDTSKLEEPEKSAIDRVRPRLKQLPFGSPEHTTLKRQFSDHHYAVNDHHIEHHANGIAGMTLGSLYEMFCDWLAAVETSGPDDNIFKSIDIISEQKGICDQLKQIFVNTAIWFGKIPTAANS